MKYLINTTEVYRVNSEEEASTLIENAKEASEYSLTKYNVQYKERKQKGEVVDFYWKVSLTKGFNDEKEPERDIAVNYDRESAF